MASFRPLLLIGTRPEEIKMAPVIHECLRLPKAIAPIVCSAGQHRRLLQQVVDYFGIPVERDLQLMRPNQALAHFASRCLTAIDRLLSEVKPDCIVVQGDTSTVLCAALASFYRRVPLVHVEAGLRTGNLYAPWPEELNRRVASLVGRLHCAPTQRAVDRLLRDAIDPTTVHLTGNTVVDALLWSITRERQQARDTHWNQRYPMIGSHRMVLVTAHRRESFGSGLAAIARAIAELSRQFPAVQFVYPVHLNPNVQNVMRSALSGLDNVHLVAPASYPAFVWLMDRSTLILTDSGGVQEEAPTLKKPVLVMRETTERPEAVEAGAAELIGTSAERIQERVALLLTDPAEYARRQIDRNPYGDGRAAARIVQLMLDAEWRA